MIVRSQACTTCLLFPRRSQAAGTVARTEAQPTAQPLAISMEQHPGVWCALHMPGLPPLV